MRTILAALALCAACGSGGGSDLPDAAAVADNGVAPCGKPVVYVNADGVTIEQSDDGLDDATADYSGVLLLGTRQPGDVEVTAPPNAGALRQSVLDTFTDLLIPAYATRPGAGEYVMLVVLEDSYFGPASGLTSMAPTDCDDQQPSNIAYVNAMFSGGQIGVAARFALGTTLGLDPVPSTAGANCMRADVVLGGCGFADGVMVDDTASTCTDSTQAQLAILADRVGC